MLENRLSENNILVGEIQDQVIDLSKKEQEKVVEPQKEDVVVLPDDAMKVLSKVTVKGVTADIDENIKAENIKLGVNILGIEGNVAPDKPDQEKTIYPSEEEQIVKADNGFELAKVIAKPVETESFEIEPSTSEQVVKASDGKYIKEVKVGAIEDIDPEITKQETLLADLKNQVDELKDISDETLNINENGEYDVKDYGKVVVRVGSGLIEIDLPSEFANSNTIYHKKINNKIIISGNASNSIWSYDIDTGKFKKLWHEGYCTEFQQVDDKKWLFPYIRTSYTLIYDVTTDSVKRMSPSNGKVRYLDGTKWLVGDSSSNGSGPLYVYDSVDDSSYKIYDNFAFFSGTFNKVNDNEFLIYAKSSGFVWLDLLNRTGTELFKDNIARSRIGQIKDRAIYVSKTTGYGITVADLTNKTFETIYSPSTTVNTIIGEFGDKLLLGGSRSGMSSEKGLVIYDYSQNTVTVYEEDSTSPRYVYELEPNKIIILTGTYSILYNPETGEITETTPISGGLWLNKWTKVADTLYLVTTDNVMTGNAGYGVFLFDSSNNTATRPYTSGFGWNTVQKVNDDIWLLANSSNNQYSGKGILKFTLSTKKVVNKFSYGDYNNVEQLENGNYRFFKNKPTSKDMDVIYDVATDTIIFDKYYLEV